ncbi:MAG: histidine kinase N-terminal 7TM domain-containing protein, partial [Anaerolineales bacterium]
MYPGALPYVLALLAVASLTLGIAVYAFRRAGQPGALIFGLCTAAMGEWAAFYALELFAPDLPNKLWAAKMEYLGIAAVPPLWLAFAVQYTGRVRWLTRGTRLLLVVPAAVTFALALTNEWHHLIWSGVRLDPGGAPALDVLGHGAWFWVHVSISYAFVLAGFVLYVRAFARAARPYRHQMILMMLGAVAPLAGNVVFLTGLFPLPWLDLTPFAFMASGVLLALGF